MRCEQGATQLIHFAVTNVATTSGWFLKTQDHILERVAQAYDKYPVELMIYNVNNKGDCHNNQILNHRLLQKGFVGKTCRENTSLWRLWFQMSVKELRNLILQGGLGGHQRLFRLKVIGLFLEGKGQLGFPMATLFQRPLAKSCFLCFDVSFLGQVR